MGRSKTRGTAYRCNVCGSEVTVIGTKLGEFDPQCCNEPMVLKANRGRFYVCPVCRAEIALIGTQPEAFEPQCCNEPMVLEAA